MSLKALHRAGQSQTFVKCLMRDWLNREMNELLSGEAVGPMTPSTVVHGLPGGVSSLPPTHPRPDSHLRRGMGSGMDLSSPHQPPRQLHKAFSLWLERRSPSEPRKQLPVDQPVWCDHAVGPSKATGGNFQCGRTRTVATLTRHGTHWPQRQFGLTLPLL